MPSTSSLAAAPQPSRFGSNEPAAANNNSTVNHDASMSFHHRIRPDRDDASSGYDSPDENDTFEKPPHQLVQQ